MCILIQIVILLNALTKKMKLIDILEFDLTSNVCTPGQSCLPPCEVMWLDHPIAGRLGKGWEAVTLISLEYFSYELPSTWIIFEFIMLSTYGLTRILILLRARFI